MSREMVFLTEARETREKFYISCFLEKEWILSFQDCHSSLILALCATEDIEEQEKHLLYLRIITVYWTSIVALYISNSNGPEILKECFQKWLRSPRIL